MTKKKLQINGSLPTKKFKRLNKVLPGLATVWYIGFSTFYILFSMYIFILDKSNVPKFPLSPWSTV